MYMLTNMSYTLMQDVGNLACLQHLGSQRFVACQLAEKV